MAWASIGWTAVALSRHRMARSQKAAAGQAVAAGTAPGAIRVICQPGMPDPGP